MNPDDLRRCDAIEWSLPGAKLVAGGAVCQKISDRVADMRNLPAGLISGQPAGIRTGLTR